VERFWRTELGARSRIVIVVITGTIENYALGVIAFLDWEAP
jgi:hypothetical protein